MHFALCPEMRITLRIPHVGGAEIESLLRLRCVFDGERDGGPRSNGLGKHNLKIGLGDREVTQRLLVASHGGDGQVDCIESQHLNGCCQNRGGNRGGAGHRLGSEVGCDVEFDVGHINLPVGRVVVAALEFETRGQHCCPFVDLIAVAANDLTGSQRQGPQKEGGPQQHAEGEMKKAQTHQGAPLGEDTRTDETLLCQGLSLIQAAELFTMVAARDAWSCRSARVW